MQNEFSSSVYKLSKFLAKDVRKLVKTHMDKLDQFTVGNQMIRSSLSIPSNIAEGFGRNSNAQKITFFNYAHGSCCELIAQIDNIEEDYTSEEYRSKIKDFMERAMNVKFQLFKLIEHYNNK